MVCTNVTNGGFGREASSSTDNFEKFAMALEIYFSSLQLKGNATGC